MANHRCLPILTCRSVNLHRREIVLNYFPHVALIGGRDQHIGCPLLAATPEFGFIESVGFSLNGLDASLIKVSLRHHYFLLSDVTIRE